MAHFNLENDINNLVRMDAPLTKGPKMRWQRKMSDTRNISQNDSVLNSSSANTSCSQLMKVSTTKSTGASSKTPGKSPNKTPTRKGAKTPSKTPSGSGDRFIPNRSATQFELGHYLLTNRSGDENAEEAVSPSKEKFRKAMNENLNGEALSSKIIAYQQKAPAAPDGYQNSLKVLYSQTKDSSSTAKKVSRVIPQVPDRILDAPQFIDDYYLNLIDWSAKNMLAVCLAGHVYLWNAESGDIQQLVELEGPDEYVSSCAWIKEGNILAIGCSNAQVQIWDVERQKRLRCMTSHSARIGALSWNSYILSSGSRSGYIHHHDVRAPDHHVGTLAGHTQEVCGLKWSPDGRHLASGGNDNLLQIWAAEANQCTTLAQPLYTFTQHQAAVKALAWCPWQPSLLASGGGTADRHIRFWNISTGSCVNSVDTKSQVCSLLWSTEHKELVSSHGFAHNQLILWKYPSMTKVAELTGHTARVLHMAMSPDGSTVVSAAADESLCFWKCFASDPEKKKSQKVVARKTDSQLTMRQSIR